MTPRPLDLLTFVQDLEGVNFAVRPFVFVHVPLYFEALRCLCPVSDIIDSLYGLLTCDMTSNLCKYLCFGFKAFLQYVIVFNLYAYIFLFYFAFKVLLDGSART